MLTVRAAQIQAMAEAAPNRKMVLPCKDRATWIEIQLLDDDDQPIPRAEYRLQLPDGSIMQGTLDEHGLARVDQIVAGSCEVYFPTIDGKEWRQI